MAPYQLFDEVVDEARKVGSPYQRVNSLFAQLILQANHVDRTRTTKCNFTDDNVCSPRPFFRTCSFGLHLTILAAWSTIFFIRRYESESMAAMI
jgi:hypothetical protein